MNQSKLVDDDSWVHHDQGDSHDNEDPDDDDNGGC